MQHVQAVDTHKHIPSTNPTVNHVHTCPLSFEGFSGSGPKFGRHPHPQLSQQELGYLSKLWNRSKNIRIQGSKAQTSNQRPKRRLKKIRNIQGNNVIH